MLGFFDIRIVGRNMRTFGKPNIYCSLLEASTGLLTVWLVTGPNLGEVEASYSVLDVVESKLSISRACKSYIVSRAAVRRGLKKYDAHGLDFVGLRGRPKYLSSTSNEVAVEALKYLAARSEASSVHVVSEVLETEKRRELAAEWVSDELCDPQPVTHPTRDQVNGFLKRNEFEARKPRVSESERFNASSSDSDQLSPVSGHHCGRRSSSPHSVQSPTEDP